MIFAAVGGANTAGYFVLAMLLAAAGLTDTVAAYVAYFCMVPLSFIGHRRLTFASDGDAKAEWLRFCWVQAASLTVIWSITQLNEAGYLTGWATFAAISILIPLINFICFQLWVFADHLRR